MNCPSLAANKQINTPYMINELTEIRAELLTGVENKDLNYIKMQINKIDTLIYNASKNNSVCVNCDENKEVYNICSDCLTRIINENS